MLASFLQNVRRKTTPTYYQTRNRLRYIHALVSVVNRRKGRTVPRCTTHAMLMIPGYMGPSLVTYPFEVMFDRYGGIPSFSHHIGLHTVRSFNALVDRLTEQIVAIRQACPELRRLDITAHSMGGLLAMEALARGTLDGLQCRLVTLGTPYDGTWVALAGCGISLSAYRLTPLHPDTWLPSRNSRLDQVPFLSIAGGMDRIAPAHRCTHHQATNLVVQHAGHADLIMSRRVFHIALRHFQRDVNHPVILTP